MKKLNLILAVVFLASCASKPQKASKKAEGTPVEKKAEVKPTFDEKVKVATVESMGSKAVCPRDGAWNGLDWRKIVPMANACVAKSDWRKVEQIGAYLGVHHSLTPWGAYYMSVAAGVRKDYPRAVWMMELALKKAPNEGLFHYQLGRMYWEMDDSQSALKEMKMASEMNEGLTDAHWIMGQIAMQRGEMAEAEQLLGKALDNDSRHFGALMAMASLKSKGKDWRGAEAYLSKAVSVKPKDGVARQALNQIQDKIKAEQPQVSTQKVTSRKPANGKKVKE